MFAAAARTAPENVAGVRALLAQDPESRVTRDLSRLFEDQLAQVAEEEAAAAQNTPSTGQ